MLTVLFAVLVVFSTIGSTAFVAPAGAAPINSGSAQSSLSASSEPVESDASTNDPAETSDTQESISNTGVQSQVANYEPVNVTTTLESVNIEKFEERKVGNGRYELSGVIDANPPKPIAPVGHPVQLRLNIYEDGERVATDMVQIYLEAGSVRPHQIRVNGTVVDLHKHHENNTNPEAMSFKVKDFDDDGTEERVVVNRTGAVVRDENLQPIINSNTTVEANAIRDPYTSKFEFVTELGKNKTYDYELNFSASDGPEIDLIQVGDITVTNASDSTSVSSQHQVLTNNRWRNGSDVTFVTSYKSTTQQSEQEVYEALALPTRGEYRADPLSPTGDVKGFAHASSNNGEFAQFLPDTENRIRITTSTQTVPANQPQTVVIRYVPPGNGEMRVIPIDSGGVPITAGPNSAQEYDEIGYELPADPTKKDYVAGGDNSRTNLAVIQLSDKEQAQLNQQGELFLSYESQTSDEFRLYCQAVLTGTIDRDSDACGINATPVDSFTNGVIANMTVSPTNATFTGSINNESDILYGLNPNSPDGVNITVKVRNAGTDPIQNEPVNLFKNSQVSENIENDTEQEIGYDLSPGETDTRTMTLNSNFSGEDMFIRTDMDTGDGTILVSVDNNKGDTKEFVYDGHQGLIEERLDGMAPSDTWTVSITSEMATGQQEPEVNSVTLEGRVVTANNMTKKTVTLGPGETTEVHWEDVPTNNTVNDEQITYQAHFYDNTDSVITYSNVSGCDRSSDDTSCPSPTAVITGPSRIAAQQTGSTLVREGTQTVRDTECPDGSGDNCGSSSDWTLEEENVGTVSGTQTMTTRESGIPLNESLLGTSQYDGNFKPLERGGVQYPYKNLPGNDSEWTLEGYQTVDIVDSESIVRTKSQMIEMYGSLDAAHRAGWSITTSNVRTTTTSVQYDHFRVLKGGTTVNEEGSEIDTTSGDWSRVTAEEYSHSNISEPLTVTKTTEVDTRIQRYNPGNGTLEDEDDWEKRERVEKIVNRSYDAGVIEEYFHSSPGGDWEFNDSDPLFCYTSDEGCRYTKPAIEEEYWTYEWVKLEDREYQLHKKPVEENVHEWTRNFYKVDVEWSRSMSGTVNKYSGPSYTENNNYESAQGVYHAKDSKPSIRGTEIVDYRWTINGETATPQVVEKNFSSGEITVVSETSVMLSEMYDFELSNYEHHENFTVSDYHSDDIEYQPFELSFVLQVDDRNEGSIQLEITNDKGITKVHRILGENIPEDGEIKINLASGSGFKRQSDYYNVNISGTAAKGETVPAVNSIELVGNATRGTDTLEVNTTQTGKMNIGLTVVDSQGLTDTTNRTVEITQCTGSRMCSPKDRGGGSISGGDKGTSYPSVTVEDYSRMADYKLDNEVASVTAQVSHLDGNQYYVVELVPGDVSADAAKAELCGPSQTALSGTEVIANYDEWGGVEESDIEGNVKYCVYDTESTTGITGGHDVYVEEAIQEDTAVRKVIWEGKQTAGTSENIYFTINPRANSQIDVGQNDFKIQLRPLGSNSPVDTAEFDVFFCHALNKDPSTRSLAPEDRQTRQQGGLMCPNLNSDFDNFNENVTVNGTEYNPGDSAPDGVDACPYDPTRANFTYSLGEEDNSCNINVPAGKIGISWDNFSDANDNEQSRHIVYFNRYADVGYGNAPDTTNTVLRLGYNTRYTDNFKQNHLLAYYPLSEPAFQMYGITEVEEEGDTTSYSSGEIGGGDSIKDISTTLDDDNKSVIASPAWSLAQTDPNDVDATYPYKNEWIAVDLSNNRYHAPILHSRTQMKTEGSVITYAGSFGGDYEYFWRGDTDKTLDRGKEGPYGGSAYRFDGESFFVPTNMESTRYQNDFTDSEAFDYGNCDNSDCWLPRVDNSKSPIGGPGWNEQMAEDLKSTDEFTVSMYVKPGQHTGENSGRNAWFQQGLNRTAFYEFQDWNGYRFGLLRDGQKTQMHVGYATGAFYAGAPQYNNMHMWNQDEDTGDKYMHFGAPDHGGHAWPDLPSMIAKDQTDNLNRTPLSPEYTGYTIGNDAVYHKQKALAMSMGYKTIKSPPRMKSLRASDHTTIMSNSDTGRGTGWRHIVITGDKNSKMTYYVDGLPYRTNVSSGKLNCWGCSIDTLDYGEGQASFGGFQGSDMIHIVGAEVQNARTGNYLQDWYMSDYRIYNQKMTHAQVNERLVIDEGQYRSVNRTFTQNEEIQPPDGVTVEMMLQEVDPDNMTINMRGDLNGGAVTVTAYPVDDSGNRINQDEYLRVHYNETQSVNNTSFFDGKDVIRITSDEVYGQNELSKADTTCQHYKMTCTETADSIEFEYLNTLPNFVGKDVLMALDNGTINSETAFDILNRYDENTYYLLDKRDFWESSIHYSTGSEVTMEDVYYDSEENVMYGAANPDNPNIEQGITSQSRFETAVGYEKVFIKNETNTLNVSDDEQMYDNWEIVVTIEKRKHTHTGPEIEEIQVANYDAETGNLGECNDEIYRCDT